MSVWLPSRAVASAVPREAAWTVRDLPSDHEGLLKRIEKRFQLHPLVARLLLQRSLLEEGPIEVFLNGTLADLPNPFLLPEMDRAVDRLLQAVERRERILFFGDYDVDGITGTAQFQSYFREIGLPTRALLPHRLQDGYGLTEKSVQKIVAIKPDLLVTIDNGTKARDEITHLKNQGIDVIVIDHHEAPSIEHRPDVVALVNPKSQKSNSSNWTEPDIASAGLVFLVLMAFRSRCREKGLSPLPNLKRYLDLACLGTIADIVPITGTNRLLVRFGLEEIANTSRPGLRALCKAASISPPVSTGSIAFRIAPRINAAGRLDDPKIALNLLLAESEAEAAPLVQKLEDLNRERQRIEASTTAEAIEMVERDAASRGTSRADAREGRQTPPRIGITVAKEGWHLGVVGIVASKLVEHFGRPSVVLAISEDGREARGSARTVPGFSIHAALKRIEGEMIRFGGHAAAAGMTIDASNLPRFSEKFDVSVREAWNERHDPTLIIDAEIALSEIQSSLVRDLSRLEPHGPGNPEPVFGASRVRLDGCRIVGQGGIGTGHLKMILSQEDTHLDAIGFNWGRYLQEAVKEEFHQIAFLPQFNTWNGAENIQIKIKWMNPTDRNH